MEKFWCTLRFIYQARGGVKKQLDGGFVMLGKPEVGFRVHNVDGTQTLVIDPVLDYSTCLADLSLSVQGVATDSSGATYIVGETFSTSYPVTAGAFQTTCSSCASNQGYLFITKLNAGGTGQVYSTYLGGNNNDQPRAITVDANGNGAVLIGTTSSTDFPLKNAISSGVPSGSDGLVSSLAPDGASLNFPTRLGGVDASGSPGTTQMAAAATDTNGNVYVSGVTTSSGFPMTPGALHAAIPSDGDGAAFLTKVGHAGSLVYGAFLGDPGQASGGAGWTERVFSSARLPISADLGDRVSLRVVNADALRCKSSGRGFESKYDSADQPVDRHSRNTDSGRYRSRQARGLR